MVCKIPRESVNKDVVAMLAGLVKDTHEEYFVKYFDVSCKRTIQAEMDSEAQIFGEQDRQGREE